MKKDDVITRGYKHTPALNVKWHVWLPDLIKKYRDKDHEFSGDAEFWEWVDGLDGTEDTVNSAWQIACENGWEQAEEAANEVWPYRHVKVYSDGRSGGWLIVDGLPEVEEWDAIALGRWAKFTRTIKETLADLDYQFIWHLNVNVWEHEHERRIDLAKRLVMA